MFVEKAFIILDILCIIIYTDTLKVEKAHLYQYFSALLSVHSSGDTAFICASARLLFVCSYMEIEFCICPLRVPQGNQHYIIAGNTLSASSFCPLGSYNSPLKLQTSLAAKFNT